MYEIYQELNQKMSKFQRRSVSFNFPYSTKLCCNLAAILFCKIGNVTAILPILLQGCRNAIFNYQYCCNRSPILQMQA